MEHQQAWLGAWYINQISWACNLALLSTITSLWLGPLKLLADPTRRLRYLWTALRKGFPVGVICQDWGPKVPGKANNFFCGHCIHHTSRGLQNRVIIQLYSCYLTNCRWYEIGFNFRIQEVRTDKYSWGGFIDYRKTNTLQNNTTLQKNQHLKLNYPKYWRFDLKKQIIWFSCQILSPLTSLDYL